MRKKLMTAAVAIGTAGPLQAASLNLEVDDYLEFSSLSSPDSSQVEGTLRVVNPAQFAPATLDIIGGIGLDGTNNVNAPSGERNGDVYFDSGAISVGQITLSAAGRLFVNGTSTVVSLAADGPVVVDANLFVTGSPECYSSSSSTAVLAGATIDAESFTFTADVSEISGDGTVEAVSFALGQGKLSPGTGEFASGTLTLVSSSIDLTNVALQLDFAPAGSDLVAIEGEATGFVPVLPVGFDQFTPAELASDGPFVFLTADSLTADFLLLDEGLLEVYEGPALVGHMVLGTNSTSAYFTYQPVPEPATLGLLSLVVIACTRRRRSIM